MGLGNVWRLSTAQALSVASVGGAAASSSPFGTQTYAIQLAFPARYLRPVDVATAIVSPNDNGVSSTAARYCHRTGSRCSAIPLASMFPLSLTMRERSRYPSRS
jgi:hypothetical protein